MTRRYDLTNDDRLRNVINWPSGSIPTVISRSPAGPSRDFAAEDNNKQFPIALPAIDARLRMDDIAGGQLEIQGNSLAITRIEGQDTQRAFASARWDMRRLTPWGQELTLTAYGRGDVYHTDDAQDTTVAIYAGTNGWHTRAIGALRSGCQMAVRIGSSCSAASSGCVPRVQAVSDAA